MVQRAQPVLITTGQELGFVGGYIDSYRALGFAGFATEAQVECLVDGLAAEAFLAQRAGEHLPEQAGAATGGVLLLAGGAVAGAHDAALGVKAGAHAHATLGGALQRATVGGEDEVGFELGGFLAGNGRRLAQVLDGVVDADGVGELAGIHAVRWVPDGLEFLKGVDQLGTEHLGQQGGAGLAVAVLAGERAAKAEDEISGAVEERAEVAHTSLRAEVEVDAHVDAALAIVSVERAVVTELSQKG